MCCVVVVAVVVVSLSYKYVCRYIIQFGCTLLRSVAHPPPFLPPKQTHHRHADVSAKSIKHTLSNGGVTDSSVCVAIFSNLFSFANLVRTFISHRGGWHCWWFGARTRARSCRVCTYLQSFSYLKCVYTRCSSQCVCVCLCI